MGTTAGIATAADSAPEPVTWSVSPSDENGPDGRSWVELSVEPGSSVTERLAVRNLGAETATFTLTAADGYFTKTGRFNMLQSDEESVDAGTWIAVEESVTIGAGETVVLPFVVTVPENATPGDHPAGIAASVTAVGTTTDGTRVGVESRVGFRVITQVGGELAPAISLSDVSATYTPSWNLFTPGHITVTYTATNDGNTQLSFVDELSGAATPRGDVFPGESRTVTSEPVDAWPLGVVPMDVALTATVPSDPGIQVPTPRETLSVVAVPYLHLAALALLAFAVAAIVFVRRRNAASVERRIEQARAEGRREQSVLR